MTHDSVPEGWRDGPKRLLALGLFIVALGFALAVSYYFEPPAPETAKSELALLFWTLAAGWGTTVAATGWGVMTAPEGRSK